MGQDTRKERVTKRGEFQTSAEGPLQVFVYWSAYILRIMYKKGGKITQKEQRENSLELTQDQN